MQVVAIYLFGPQSSGKTSILYTALQRRFSSDPAWTGKRGYLLRPTAGFNQETLSEHSIRGAHSVEMWDFGFSSVGLQMLSKGMCGLAFVVDATTDCVEARDLFSSIHAACCRLDIPLCVFANKMDLMDARSISDISQSLVTLDVCKRRPSFRCEARLLLLVSVRKNCPKDLRKKLLDELVKIQPGPVVFGMCAPETRDIRDSTSDPREGILRGIQWLIDQLTI